MTTVRYEGGIPRVLHDEIEAVSSTTINLTAASTPTVLCNALSNPITVNLPLASTCEGVMYTIKKLDVSANTVTVQPSGSDKIDGASTYVISQQFLTVSIQSDGSAWFILEVSNTDVNGEVTARMNADSTLQSNLDFEVTARQDADCTLQANLDSETTARLESDSSLQSNLQGNIDFEVTSRVDADSTLQSNLNSEITARTNADSTLQGNINSEITARTNADSTLQSNINAITINSYGVTTNASILANDEVFADTTSGIITLTLPASPVTGNRVRVLDPKGTWGTNKCVIARNGNKIAGYASDLELTVSGDSVELVFYSATSDWRIP